MVIMAVMKQNTNLILMHNRIIKIAAIAYNSSLKHRLKMGMSHMYSDWILQSSLLQAFPVDICGISGLILQQQGRLLWFPSGMAPHNRLFHSFANARYVIVKFLCQNPY